MKRIAILLVAAGLAAPAAARVSVALSIALWIAVILCGRELASR